MKDAIHASSKEAWIGAVIICIVVGIIALFLLRSWSNNPIATARVFTIIGACVIVKLVAIIALFNSFLNYLIPTCSFQATICTLVSIICIAIIALLFSDCLNNLIPALGLLAKVRALVCIIIVSIITLLIVSWPHIPVSTLIQSAIDCTLANRIPGIALFSLAAWSLYYPIVANSNRALICAVISIDFVTIVAFFRLICLLRPEDAVPASGSRTCRCTSIVRI